MKLFDMNDRDIQKAVNAQDDRLFDLFYEAEEPPRNCENCEYWFNGSCTMAEAEYTTEEIEAMTDEEYTKLVQRNPDDCCNEHKFLED